MHENLQRQIADERAHIAALDSTLDAQRTPYIKRQLTFAGHILDDAEVGLRRATASPDSAAMWLDFVGMNLYNATTMRQKIQTIC